MSTVYGTGTNLVDYQHLELRNYSVMRWVTFFWVPIFPVEQLVIRPGRRWTDFGGGKFGTNYDFEILDHEPLSRDRVTRVYLAALSGILAAIIPLTAWIVLCKPGAGVVQSEPQKLFGLAAILWIVAVVMYFRWRSARLYQALDLPTKFE
jgi:hypothetical protein